MTSQRRGHLSLIISNPNVITHHIDNRKCWKSGTGYGSILTIEIGESYSTAAYNDEHGNTVIVKNQYGHTKTPSVIAFVPNSDYSSDNANNTRYNVLFGEDAVAQQSSNPVNTIFGWSPWIFVQFNESLAAEVQDLPFRVVQAPLSFPSTPFELYNPRHIPVHRRKWVSNPQGQAVIQVALGVEKEKTEEGIKNIYLRPEELSGMMSRRMRELAETQQANGTTFQSAIVVIPGNLDDTQRWAIRSAIENANPGMIVMRLVSRFTTPSKAYGLDKEYLPEVPGIKEAGVSNLVTLRLENTVFEASVIQIEDEVHEELESIEGRGQFGIESLYQELMQTIVERVVEATGIEFPYDHKAQVPMRERDIFPIHKDPMDQLRKEIKEKIIPLLKNCPLVESELDDSTCPHTIDLDLDSIFGGGAKGSYPFRLQEWIDIQDHRLETVILSMELALKNAEIDKKYVDYVVVSGSSGLIPHLIRKVEWYFRETKLVVPQTLDPALISVYGACTYAKLFESYEECFLA
ncbi:Heat shock- 70 kDa protein 2 [Linnemannia zychae]|nr:Heat shock- 70 kDa protein 2 [Linnemannia zychae]